MKNFYPVFETSPLFYGITPEEIQKISACLSAKEKAYQKGETIFRIGERISAAALLLEGNVHIIKVDFWGNQSILTQISPGELFGETYACLEQEPLNVSAIAEKNSKVLFLSLKKILSSCPSSCPFHTRLIQNFISVIAQKNKMLTAKIDHITQRTTREKLLSYLSEQSARKGSSVFEIPFNRQQLADYLAVDRSAMSSTLCKLREEGLLVFQKNKFELRKEGKHSWKGRK